MDDIRAFQLIDEIDKQLPELVKDQSFNPDVLNILDDLDADRRAIETIPAQIGEAVWLRIQEIAAAMYSGNLRQGAATSFYDIVTRLGMYQTKVMIMQLRIHQSADRDPQMERLLARSFATSIMAGVLALQMGFSENAIQRAELGGLYLEIGRQMMVLYRKRHAHASAEIDDTFIDAYHPYLAVKLIRRFSLPDYLQTIVLAQTVILEENAVSLAGMIYLARDMVLTSFRKYGNRLVLRCQTPRPGTDVSRTLEAIIRDKFHAAGLDQYLIILRVPRIHEW